MVKEIFILIGNSVKDSIHSLKKPTTIITTFVIGVIWLTLSLLSAKGISNEFLRIINIITFAEGGMFGGPLGAIGGILGKMLVIYLFNLIIDSIKNKRKMYKGTIKKYFSNIKINNKGELISFLFGISLALILYNIYNFKLNIENIVIAVYAIIFAFSLLKNAKNFYRQLLNIIFKYKDNIICKLVSGIIIGLLLSIGLTFVNVSYICFYVGFAFLIASIILSIVKPKRVAVAGILLFSMFIIKDVKAESWPIENYVSDKYTFKANFMADYLKDNVVNLYNEGTFITEVINTGGKYDDKGYVGGYGTIIAKQELRYHYDYPDDYEKYRNYNDSKKWEIPIPEIDTPSVSTSSISIGISASFLTYKNDSELDKTITVSKPSNCKESNQEEVTVGTRRTIKLTCKSFEKTKNTFDDGLGFKEKIVYYILMDDVVVNGAMPMLVVSVEGDGYTYYDKFYDNATNVNSALEDYISFYKETTNRLVQEFANNTISVKLLSFKANGKDLTKEVLSGKELKDNKVNNKSGGVNPNNENNLEKNHQSPVGTIVIGVTTIVISLTAGIPPIEVKRKYINIKNDGDVVVKDPVTGNKINYIKNKDGSYTSPLSGNKFTLDEIGEQINYRERNREDLAEDYREYTEFNERKREEGLSDLSKKVEKEYKDAIAKAKKEGVLDKLRYKYNLPKNATEKDILKVLIKNRVDAQVDFQNTKAKEDYIDAAQNTAESIESAADYSIAIGEAMVPGGKVVSAAYKGLKNVAATTAEKGIKSGLTEGIIKGAAEASTTLMDNGITKVATTIGGDTVGSMVGAAVRKEDIVEAGKKGFARGTGNATAGVISDQIGDVGGKAAGAIGNVGNTYYGKNVLNPGVEKKFQ